MDKRSGILDRMGHIDDFQIYCIPSQHRSFRCLSTKREIYQADVTLSEHETRPLPCGLQTPLYRLRDGAGQRQRTAEHAPRDIESSASSKLRLSLDSQLLQGTGGCGLTFRNYHLHDTARLFSRCGARPPGPRAVAGVETRKAVGAQAARCGCFQGEPPRVCR